VGIGERLKMNLKRSYCEGNSLQERPGLRSFNSFSQTLFVISQHLGMYLWNYSHPPLLGAIGAISGGKVGWIKRVVHVIRAVLVGVQSNYNKYMQRRADNDDNQFSISIFLYAIKTLPAFFGRHSARHLVSESVIRDLASFPGLNFDLFPFCCLPFSKTNTDWRTAISMVIFVFSSPLQAFQNLRSGWMELSWNYRKFGFHLSHFPWEIMTCCFMLWTSLESNSLV